MERAQVVDDLNEPSVEINADSTSFIMLACGRVDPQEEIDAGRISWSGDAVGRKGSTQSSLHYVTRKNASVADFDLENALMAVMSNCGP